MSDNEPTSNCGAPHCRKNDNIGGYVITSTIYIYIYICNVCTISCSILIYIYIYINEYKHHIMRIYFIPSKKHKFLGQYNQP